MALKKTATGKVDKRTTEYKEMVERAKKAREAAKKEKEKAAKKSDKKTTASNGVKRKADGKETFVPKKEKL